MKIIEVFELPDGHPEVMQWAAEISSRLPDTYGHILQTLARFADENGRVCGPSQYEIARYARVTPGKVSEVLRTIGYLGPIKSSSRKGLKEGSSKEYQLMGNYQDWTIWISLDDLDKPNKTLSSKMAEAHEREMEELRQDTAVTYRKLMVSYQEHMRVLEALGRFEEISALEEKVETLKSRYGSDF